MVMIVQGTFRVEPQQRDAFLAGRLETMLNSRAEKGCIEYVLAADPLETDRVVLSERWASPEDLEAHKAALADRRKLDADQGKSEAVEPLSREVVFFEATEADDA